MLNSVYVVILYQKEGRELEKSSHIAEIGREN